MNNLFNQKILAKKAEEEVDLSRHNLSERRKALDKWINNLENGVLDNSKEEEFQGEFLYDIFTTVLRAVNKSDGEKEWNLERETKTKMDGQKADGVLGFFDVDGKKDVRAVIELKGAKVSLDVRQKRVGDTRSPVEQAFRYAPKYGSSCQWVIVSNYKEIRLYRQNEMNEYQVFFLEDLKDDLEFKKFIYVLSFYSLVGTKNKKAKTMELSEEYQKNQAEIEKKFYNEYKNIRMHIFENMRKNNPQINEHILIEKVQKLLDRFLFICFCEDKGLLPHNSYDKIVQRGEAIDDIFESFKMLCNWINIGNMKNGINKFNGGLFKNDDILDSLYVDNEVFEEMKKISGYDFDSELNENILGHIFEQSVSDIEELKKSVSGEEFDSKKSKRKKDGIFYTPKYITKYIVENSIKNWLDDKKKELGEDELPELTEKDFEISYASKKSDKRIYSENLKKHIDFWTKYREAVKNIKIVDPACGSGAFLITAFEYLLNYNNYLDDKIFDLTGVKDLFSDTTKEILQNNIFGVDLNKESVEITKLSLWLKTADGNKTLATLEDNIKCGNSLIDDPEIAGEMAFDWEKEFPEIFANGGFDIVVGNPPYVSAEYIPEIEKKYYESIYYSASGRQNLYIIFYEKALKILKKNGNLGFITPYTILKNMYYKEIREYILKNSRILEIVDFKGIIIFEDAGVDSIIFMLKKEQKEEYKITYISNIKIFENQLYDIDFFSNQKILEKEDLSMQFSKNEDFVNKFLEDKNILKLKEIVDFKQGIITGGNKKYLVLEKNDMCEKVLTGSDFNRYRLYNSSQYIIYDTKKLHRPRKRELFEVKEKLLLRQTGAFPICMIDNEQYFTLDTVHNGILKQENFDIKYVMLLLNSKFLKFIYENMINENGKLFAQVKIIYIDELPIKEISLEAQQPFIEKADKMLSLNKDLQEKVSSFQRLLIRKFELEKLSTKLQDWYLLDFSEFTKELKKSKIKLSLKEEIEWEEIFIEKKEEVEKVKNEIEITDKEIDRMVYELYGLNEEEIRIIEGD